MQKIRLKVLAFNASPLLTIQFTKVFSLISCLQVEALQAQMEEQIRLAKEQVESLLDDRKIKSEEALAQRLRNQKQIATLTDK